ncbi:MAG TPA: response regulator [Kiritimatiellia bacterium]|nr:response regulator [Kiritimatiellia bacterium]
MNERILIIDDDELVRTGLAGNLSREGYQVIQAASGREAGEKVGEASFDLAICDLMLGDMDGIDLLRHLRESTPEMAVVMLTGHGSVGNALEALQSGASDYIQKPATPEEVLHRIRTVLDTMKIRQHLQDERRRSEARKRHHHDQLSRAERMASLGLLAEGAASDLAAIMEPIHSLPEQVIDQLGSEHPQRLAVQRLGEAVARANAVIHDLRMLGRSGAYKKKPLTLNDLIDAFMATTEYRRIAATHAKIRLDISLDPALPRIAGSETHLTEAITNLYLFACEGMPSGGVIRIETSSKYLDQPGGRYGTGHPGDYVILSIRDSGNPVSNDDAERMFEPFYVRNCMGRHLVSGLGMALVYRVVMDHQGFIDLDNDPQKGNEYTIYLPAIANEEDTSLELRPDFTGKETILLVDDSSAQRSEAEAILTGLGYQVYTAESGHRAVEMVEAWKAEKGSVSIDLMIIDLILGDAFDGVETFKRIVEIEPGQKAILASGFADINRIVEARKLGMSRTYQKPYAQDGLGRMIRQVLEED